VKIVLAVGIPISPQGGRDTRVASHRFVTLHSTFAPEQVSCRHSMRAISMLPSMCAYRHACERRLVTAMGGF
jgi:hypothetical protein